MNRETEEALDEAHYWRLRSEEAEKDKAALEEENALLATRLIEHDHLLISLLLQR